MSKYKCTDEEFSQFVKDSKSIAQVIKKCGLIVAGGNYRICKNRIDRLSLDTSHFKGQAWNKGRKGDARRPITDYLSNKYPAQSNRLRGRLISEGCFTHKCYECNLTTWNDQPIPIELEHIDGNHLNNSLDNLTILCPNCHSQTSTYRGKNKKSV